MPVSVSQALTAVLALFFGVFVLWAVIANNPFGGEPMAVAPIGGHPAVAAKTPEAQKLPTVIAGTTDGYNGPSAAQPQPGKGPEAPNGTQTGAPAANTRTVTIIDGKTGQRQEVVLPAPVNDAPPSAVPVDPKFADMSPHGPIPKVAADGMRPADAFAEPVQPIPGKPDAPRIAIVVGGLGVSESVTSDAIMKLPGAVTLGFLPYSSDVAALVARARDHGHEVLLQIPMEPFDYPDNDPGPQTLLTSLTPPQNIDRLFWLMSRFQGYVGVSSAMGARFTASEPSFAPVLHEIGKRGLIYVDDGANPRSLAGRIAGANNLPFARADAVIDAVPTPIEIDHALGRLEMAAREHAVAVGIASALPVSIAHIATWAKNIEGRGILLVPITAVATKTKQAALGNQ